MLRSINHAAILTACAAVLPAGAHAQPVRTPVDQFGPLLVAALRTPDGNAYGILTGDMAAAIGRQFGTSAPIEIDVSTLVRYAQPECARLRVEVSQQGVKFATAAAPQRQDIRFELNYCSDGLPPRSLAVKEAR